MKYKVATYCENCGIKYRSRAKDSRKAVKKCKNCDSTKTMVHPDPGQDFEIPHKFVPVREG